MAEPEYEVMYDIRAQKSLIMIKVPYDYDLSKIFKEDAEAEVDNLLMSALGY